MADHYSSRERLEARYGAANILKWADLDNDQDETAIEARIELSLTNADAYIDDRLRNGPYAIPLTPADGISNTVRTIADRVAACDLYMSRGIQDYDPAGNAIHRLKGEERLADQALADILNGRIRLTGVDTISGETNRSPSVVKESS